jgi:hypothetical protein
VTFSHLIEKESVGISMVCLISPLASPPFSITQILKRMEFDDDQSRYFLKLALTCAGNAGATLNLKTEMKKFARFLHSAKNTESSDRVDKAARRAIKEQKDASEAEAKAASYVAHLALARSLLRLLLVVLPRCHV